MYTVLIWSKTREHIVKIVALTQFDGADEVDSAFIVERRNIICYTLWNQLTASLNELCRQSLWRWTSQSEKDEMLVTEDLFWQCDLYFWSSVCLSYTHDPTRDKAILQFCIFPNRCDLHNLSFSPLNQSSNYEFIIKLCPTFEDFKQNKESI